MSEFTGERVIPGQVEVDLWNEHFARYAFASRFAAGRRVLDLGCGTGYGAAELSRTAESVVGLDLAEDAIAWARERFPLPNLTFVTGAASAVPKPDSSFHLITAFEVIEHLEDWRGLLSEIHRLLTPGGVALISTPNKDYYTESRGDEGENPFHVHEFEALEFQSELEALFGYVQVFQQNRLEAFGFYPARTFFATDCRIDSSGGDQETAHFFVAVCSETPVPDLRSFLYVPRAANVLRERERHIVLLQEQLHQAQGERDRLLEELRKQKEHLEEQNRWAMGLEREWKAAQERIGQLQKEFAAEQAAAAETARKYDLKVRELEEDALQKAEWAIETDRRLTSEITDLRARFAETLQRLDAAEATVTERTQWALDLQSKLEDASARLAGGRASRWVRTGRLFGLGPEL